jgi:hypothetical protein
MRWRVLVELAGANGAVEVHEVGVGEHPPAGQRRKAPQVMDGLPGGGEGGRQVGPAGDLAGDIPVQPAEEGAEPPDVAQRLPVAGPVHWLHNALSPRRRVP